MAVQAVLFYFVLMKQYECTLHRDSPAHIPFRRKVTFLFSGMFNCGNCQNENASLQTCALHFLCYTLSTFYAASLWLPNPESRNPCSQTVLPSCCSCLPKTSWAVLGSQIPIGTQSSLKVQSLRSPQSQAGFLSLSFETGSRFLEHFQVLVCWELVAISVIQARRIQSLGMSQNWTMSLRNSFVFYFYGLLSLSNNITFMC